VTKDLDKRKRVMARSMQLGHCICDPKKPCPCDNFREKDLCPCAGERPPARPGPVLLTQLVDSPGCASKIDEATLKRVLGGLPAMEDPRVLVGVPAGDDAGVYRLSEATALVQTVDVFTPSVDDPYLFGQIAAANSLSDVYAMGGRPVTALSIIGFPVRELDDALMREILRGGIDKMTEAGVPVIGGHSINDPQIKAGFAVTGLVDPQKIVTNAAARPGDQLVLTKPLGSGVMAFAAQIGRAPPDGQEAAARSMAMLNRRAAELMIEYHARACTDVTGFGLMGHLWAMAAASGVDAEIIWDDLPLLPGVLECAAEGILPGAVERNRESSGHAAVVDEGLAPAMLDLCFDPQTSGGLLIAAPPAAAMALVARLRAEGFAATAIIGRILRPGSGRVFVRAQGRRTVPAGRATGGDRLVARRIPAEAEPCSVHGESAMGCCPESQPADRPAAGHGAGVSVVQQKFQEFLQAANAPGALDAKTKQAVSIALSVLARCEPCVKHHVAKAREIGFTPEEIDEAAWMAIGFGGSPTMMFYKKLRNG